MAERERNRERKSLERKRERDEDTCRYTEPIMAQSLSLDTTSACMSQVGIRKAMRRTLAHTAGVTVSSLGDSEHGCDATCTSYSRCLCDDAVAAYCNVFPAV